MGAGAATGTGGTTGSAGATGVEGATALGAATVSDIGYEASTSTGALAFGGATVAAATALRGVPSTGQKLNRSANCSWQVLQNFILTTSLSRWGSSELKLPTELID